jgi:LysM repeat protein
MSLDSISATIANPLTQAVKKPKLRGNDFPHGFQIFEYINGVKQGDTKLVLVGNLMPFQPFEWDGEQRLITNYYAGNPEPVVQVLGPKEGPVTIKGRLKDKRYSLTDANGTSYYGVSYQFNLAINEMRKRGNLVKFGMAGPDGAWIRFGFIQKASFKMNKLSWIDYEVTFLVVSETQPINNYFSANEQAAPATVNQNLINAASSFAANYSSVPDTVPQSIAGAINGYISTVATAINTVTGFVGNIVSTAQSIQASANRALGLIKNAQATISTFNRNIDALAHGFNTLSSQGNSAGQVRDTYANISYIAETMKATLQLQLYLAQMQAQWIALSVTVPKARYRVQQNDTLQNISIKFYQTAANASVIAEHNNLTSNTLVAGTILEIPSA